MERLIDNLEYIQELLGNSLTIQDISEEKYTKVYFFNKYEYQDIIKYRKIFLDEKKSLLLYLVKFYKDDSIVVRKYPNNFAVGRPNQ